MTKTGYAYFVRSPHRIDELMCPHPVESEREVEVVKTITLPAIDYENFVTDMLADREFIEHNENLCSREKAWKCILVRQHGKKGGVLVMPMERCFVG